MSILLPKNCPNCRATLIDDVWENINEDLDGTIHQEIIIPAWVCSKFCGYYQKVEESHPKLNDLHGIPHSSRTITSEIK